MQTCTEPMDASKQFCPNEACSARGQKEQGNISIHDRKRQRYRCKACKHTFSARRGTMLEGLRKPMDLIVIVVTLLTYGCPVQAIVHAFELDERTVADWRDRAGAHCQKVHKELVEQGRLDLMHVQADEIRVKGCKMIAWMGLAMMVSTRLWVAGVVQVWREVHIGTVIKRTQKKRVVEITRRMTHGLLTQAEKLLQLSHGGIVLNTAFIERLNGTFRERLAS